ncbi:MAG: hypothetical protein C4562_02190 [Actinobacteria bacterium]|nr:MAG: hypothetical protein C4562_02190 [Actinomycetota bacterium]
MEKTVEKAKRNLINVKFLFISLTVLALSASFIVLVQGNNSAAQALKLMVTKQPERLTELFFTDYALVPKKLKAKRRYKVDFSVTNREYRKQNYTYVAVMIENNFERGLVSGSFKLANNESVVKEVRFRPTKPKANIKIIIKLINKNQQISFKATT